MDDDKKNLEGNQPAIDEGQPRPIFETVPESEGTETPPQNLQPEEVAPEIATPEEVSSAPSADSVSQPPPIYYEDNKNRYIVIGLGAIFFVVIFFLVIKLLLGSGKSPKKEIKLVYWGLWEEKEVFQPLIDQYQAKNKNIKIDYQKMLPQDYREKLIVRSEKNEGPDIFRFHNTWLPEIKNVAAALPDSVMSAKEFDQTFYPVHKTDLKIGTKYYGIPLMIDGLVLIYNDGLFKKAGITTAPTNWDEIIDSIAKLSVKDKNNQLVTAGIAIGTASNIEHFSDIFGLMLLQNGSDLKRIDQQEGVTTLEAYRKFAEPPNSFWDERMPNSITAFIQEKVAMIIAPSWEILTIKNINPDLDIKIVPVPKVPGGQTLSLASYWVEGVSSHSKNQEEAWKFLRFLVDKQNLTKLYEQEAKLKPFGEAYSRVDLGNLLAQHPYLGTVIQQASSYYSLPLASRTFDNGLNDEIIKYLENAINSTIEGVSYSESLKTAKQGIDQVFSRYQIEY